MYKYKEFSPVVANPTTYHYQKAMVLKRYLENETFQNIDNNLIALYGEWGSGKSTVFKTLKAELEKESEKYIPLIFEAWKYEKDKNLPLSLYEFILDKIINNEDAFKKVLAEGIGKGLYSFFKGFTFNFGPISYEVSKITEEFDKENISSLYTLTENFIDNFQKQIEEYRENKKIIVFIDDLDRCDDENIITLLSGLKLMFALKNIIFICGVDRKAVEESLKLKYQNEEKANMFLKKIFPQDYILDTIKNNIIEFYDNDFPKLKIYILKNLKIFNSRSISKIYNKYISLLYLTSDKNTHIERKKDSFYFWYSVYKKKI
ncbi:hypothetical protein HUW86_09740 [Fusobacterium sp. SB021]|uniref:KAP family P-loop NTPase fold protein n=1 Tax=Fusobacterium sp. SB021 TaxID=2744227 RepID=UPI003CF122E9